jgi:hypothetical protein
MMRKTWRYLTYSILIVVSTLFWLGSVESALAKARRWGYRCVEVTLRPNPANPLNGCVRVGLFDCRGGCAVGGVIPHYQCVFGGLFCDQVLLVRFVRAPSLPCLPMFGAGGAGCVCDRTVPPSVGPIFLHLPGC